MLFIAGIEEFAAFNTNTKPIISLITDGNGYHGLVEEGANVVNVTPSIRIEKSDGHELLCNIFILQDGVRDNKSPFEVSKLQIQSK